ncbi:MAG: DUF420 domain-containing protein [Flavobacteriales bacterium]|nr:DUF420 domain-containing protein [Flavobacteriales bacterium]
MNSEIKNFSAERKAKRFVILASIFIPVAVTALYFLPKPGHVPASLRPVLNNLPSFNAIVNGTTAVVLVAAFIAIRRKNITLHRRLMTSALVLSVLFLLSYITYHFTMQHTSHGGEGTIKTVYLTVLLTHILCSIIIVPLVLISYTRALAQRFDRHRKIARITLPIWIYVAVTGVIVYLMISPYYSHNP